MNEVICRVEGEVGRLTLNRPDALNALTLGMVETMDTQLRAWAMDEAVKLVLIDAAGGRAFCAGGDVQQLYQCMLAGDLAPARTFFASEYELNRLIARYSKPVVAIMHGIVIGGGVGISAHAAHRIVTDRTLLALPECAIGLIPDVGTSLLLARAPGRLGEYIGLTGARLSGADAIFSGFADTYVPSDQLEGFVIALLDDPHPAMIDCLGWTPEASKLEGMTAEIERDFAPSNATDIAAKLVASTAPWAPAALKSMRQAAPLSIHCALRAIHTARATDTIEAALTNEYRFAMRALTHGDFQEGIRAAVIDKDRKPKWANADLGHVADPDIEAMFASLGADELNWNKELSS